MCCINANNECTSIYNNVTGDNQFLLRALNAPCNYTFGLCDATGRCTRLLQHPSLSICVFPENDGKQCGPRHFCIGRQCRHICGDVSAECECKAGSADECKVKKFVTPFLILKFMSYRTRSFSRFFLFVL